MRRSILRLATPRLPLSPLPRTLPLSLRFPLPAFASTSSSPKEAEKASAQSGGSRSKDFKEKHEAGEAEEAKAKHMGGTPFHDTLAEGDARGRTGGGEPLDSSDHPPPQPKIWNAGAPAEREKLTEEQKAEVDEHNKEFDEKHNRASPAEDDKVDKSFWGPDDGKSVKK
ncbi:hypothetical protein F5X68DRAFT_232604 [Plectosphaerella plurivora]|uniref:Uncharacterized protein n=1 Tax=Plectosphaerella plurivora TaxID=936078 RepID=A0A9P8VAW3_9PEZI|nr:hypothetical protein F5X68DRAFT_232604 [Plectosphaerella plurivora]